MKRPWLSDRALNNLILMLRIVSAFLWFFAVTTR